VALSPAEWRQFISLGIAEADITRWLYGRIAAKDAARWLWRQRTGERLLPADLEVEMSADGQAVVRRRGAAAIELAQVAITHLPGVVLAVVKGSGGPAGPEVAAILEGAPA
jgi:hypothetical protein